MPSGNVGYSYKHEYNRYRYYFGRIYQFYQQPIAQVSSALLLTIFTTIFFAVCAIKPTLITVAELMKKIEDQRQTLDQLKQKSAALATAQQEYQAASATIERLATAIPESASVPPVLIMVEGDAAIHQTSLDSLQVDEFTYQTKTVPVSSEPQEMRVAAVNHGLYPQLKQFLHDYLYLPRLFQVNVVTLNAGDQSANGPGVVMTLDSKMFHLSKPPSPTPIPIP